MTLIENPRARPELRRTVEVLELDDAIHLVPAFEHREHVLRGPTEAQRALIAMLDGRWMVDEIAARLSRLHGVRPADVIAGVGQLDALGLLQDGAAKPTGVPAAEVLRFDRQVTYLQDLGGGSLGVAHDAQRRLREATVLVVGLGGIGTWAAAALVAAGVGRLVAYDDDVVETSDLSRQVLYGEADVGRRRAEVARARLQAMSSLTQVTCHARGLRDPGHVMDAIGDAQLVVESADEPPYPLSRWLNRACLAAAVPHISCALGTPHARVGPLLVPGQTGCFECVEAQLRDGAARYDELASARAGRPNTAATFGPAAAALAGMLATEAAHVLAGVASPLRGAWVELDLRDWSSARRSVPWRRDCAAGCPRPAAGDGAAVRSFSRV